MYKYIPFIWKKITIQLKNKLKHFNKYTVTLDIFKICFFYNQTMISECLESLIKF